MVRLFSLLLAFWAAAAWAQVNRGELRFSILDPSGAALRAKVDLDSRASHFHQTLETDATGHLTFETLPFGVYEISVEHSGFTRYHATVDIHSVIPQERRIRLGLAGVKTEITVSEERQIATQIVNR